MPFQFNMQFYSQTFGWRETLYSNDANINDARLTILLLAPERGRLLAPGAFMKGVYIRDCGRLVLPPLARNAPYQQTQWVPWQQGSGATKGGLVNETNSDQPWQSLRVRLTSSGIYARSLFVRGVSDQWVAYNPDNTLNLLPAAYTAMKRYVGALAAGRLGWLALVRGGVNGPSNVTGLVVDTAGRVQVTVVNPNFFAVNAKVLVTGMQGTGLFQKLPGRRGVNGLHTVYAINGNNLTIDLLASTLVSPPVWAQGGQVFPRQMIFVSTDVPPAEGNLFVVPAEKRPGRDATNARARGRVTFRNTNS